MVQGRKNEPIPPGRYRFSENFVNHWPPRSQGLYESEPLRIGVANHLGMLVDERLKVPRADYLGMSDTRETLRKINRKWNRNVHIMGDLNDEPHNRSVIDYLKASSDLDHLEEELKPSGGAAGSRSLYFLKRRKETAKRI